MEPWSSFPASVASTLFRLKLHLPPPPSLPPSLGLVPPNPQPPPPQDLTLAHPAPSARHGPPEDPRRGRAVEEVHEGHRGPQRRQVRHEAQIHHLSHGSQSQRAREAESRSSARKEVAKNPEVQKYVKGTMCTGNKRGFVAVSKEITRTCTKNLGASVVSFFSLAFKGPGKMEKNKVHLLAPLFV